MVVDSGKFDWTDPKFALYNEPDGGYHGLRFAHDLPDPLKPVAFSLRLLTVGIRNQGPTLAPDAAWIFLQGVESLPLRIARHSENALAVAKHLEKHPKVAWVKYPSLSQPELAAKYLPNGAGGMVVVGVKGGSKEARAFADALNGEIFSLLANVGDAKSLVIGLTVESLSGMRGASAPRHPTTAQKKGGTSRNEPRPMSGSNADSNPPSPLNR